MRKRWNISFCIRTEERPCEDAVRTWLSASQKESSHQNVITISIFQSPEKQEKLISCLSHPVYGVLLWQPEQIKTEAYCEETVIKAVWCQKKHWHIVNGTGSRNRPTNIWSTGFPHVIKATQCKKDNVFNKWHYSNWVSICKKEKFISIHNLCPILKATQNGSRTEIPNQKV